MTTLKLIILTCITMIAFASNSLICRFALTHTNIDAASFTTIRIISGALPLYLITKFKGYAIGKKGNWLSALALLFYAGAFSFSYRSLSAATGALLLFGTVQVTMISHGLWSGEKPVKQQYIGIVLAFVGLVALLFPGLSAPPMGGTLLMIGAGIGWSIYSFRGREKGDALSMSAGNFLRAIPIALLMSLLMSREVVFDPLGTYCAIASGALATGIVYVVWYKLLVSLNDTNAAVVQLSVPVIAALGGIILLGEPIMTLRYIFAAVATLGGISLALLGKRCGNFSIDPC
jgi:drug/metabolite transporter (DMT)-like permease